MTREVLETDNEGRAVVVVYRESDDERAQRVEERAEQAERGRQVARSLRRTRPESSSSEPSTKK